MKSIIYLSIGFLAVWSFLFAYESLLIPVDFSSDETPLYSRLPSAVVCPTGACDSETGGSPLILKEGGSPLVLKGGLRATECSLHAGSCLSGPTSSYNYSFVCNNANWATYPSSVDGCTSGTSCYNFLGQCDAYSDCFCIGDGVCDTEAGETSASTDCGGINGTNFECTARNTACQAGETSILKMAGITNSHVEKANFSINGTEFNTNLCCKVNGGSVTVSYVNNTGTRIGSVSNPGYPQDQRHFSTGISPVSNDNIYLSSSLGTVSCTSVIGITGQTGAQACLASFGGGCILTLTDTDSGHVGDCSQSYSNALCCKA